MKNSGSLLLPALLTGLVSFSQHVCAQWPEPSWDRALAVRAASAEDMRPTVAVLFELARQRRNEELLDALQRVELDSSRPLPAREYALHVFAGGLADLPPRSVSREITAHLMAYRPRTLVPHEEHAGIGVPLFNIRAAAAGSLRAWERADGAREARRLADAHGESWIMAYLAGSPAQRDGFVDTLETTGRDQLRDLLTATVTELPREPALTAVATRAAVILHDPEGLAAAVASGRGPSIAPSLREAAGAFEAADRLHLLQRLLRDAPAETAAAGIAELAPGLLANTVAVDLLFETLNAPALGAGAALVLSRSNDPVVLARLENLAVGAVGLAAARAALALSLRDTIRAPADLATRPESQP